jgi:hypothetical protein
MTKFYVKHLYKYLDVAKIVWYHQEHTHEVSSPTHGAFDLESQSLKSWYRNPILIKLKPWTQEQLDNGLTTKQLYKEHKKIWYHAWLIGKKTCGDDLLTQ